MRNIKSYLQSIAWKGIFIIILFSATSLNADNGPGGIGKTNGESGLALWLRADQNVEIEQNVENNHLKVQKWMDLSGNGFTLRQTNSENRPDLVNDGINGKAFIQFDRGSKDFLSGTGFKGLVNKKDYTIFIVGESAQVGGQVLLSGVESAKEKRGKTGLYIAKPKPSIHPTHNAASNYRFTHRSSFKLSQKSGNNVYTTVNNSAEKNTQILGFVKHGKQEQTVRINSEEVKHEALSNGANKPFTSGLDLTIGSLADWMNSMNLHGHVGEVIIFNRALSDIETKTVEKYLHKRYGIKEPEKEKTENTPDPVQGLEGIGKSQGTAISSLSTGSLTISDISYLEGNGNYLFAGFKPLSNANGFVHLPKFPQSAANAWWLDIDKQTSQETGGKIAIAFNYTEGQEKPGKANNYRLILKSPKSVSAEVIPVRPEINANQLTFKFDIKVIQEYFPQNKGWLTLGTKKPTNAPLPEDLDPGYIEADSDARILGNAE